VNDYWKLFIWAVLIGGAFAVMWRTGQLARLSLYVAETREELRKCTWPSTEELKGSTVLVLVTILSLGVFTIAVDFVLLNVIRFILQL